MKLIVYPVLDEGPCKYSVQVGMGFDVRGGDSDVGAPVVCAAEGVVVDVG